MIKSCTPCKPHSFQDARYGPNLRVHTEGGRGAKSTKGCCTVCGTQKDLSSKDGKLAVAKKGKEGDEKPTDNAKQGESK